jgi:outer membrane protein
MFTKLITLLAVPVLLGAQQMPDPSTHTITLQEAIRLARQNNVGAITAANQVRSAALQIRSNKAQLYPSLTTNFGASKSAGQKLGEGQKLIATASPWAFSNGLSLSQTLFDGGKSYADVRAARANVVSAEANEVAQDFTISLNVKTQYNSILAAQEADAAARAQLALAQQQLDVSIAKVNAGAANVADSLNSVVSVGTAQIAILTAQQNLRAASAALTSLVGTPYLVTASLGDTIDRPQTSLDSAALMTWALDGPSIRQSQAQLNLANAQERSARTGYFPTVRASGSYGGSGSNNPYGLGSNPVYPFLYNRSVSVNLSFPIFQGYSRENSVVNAQIAADNAQAQIKNQKLLAQQTIITQIGVIRNDEEKIRVQLVSIRASEEALRVNQQRYQLGAGTLIELLTTQQNLIVARQQLIQTRLDLRNARAQIEAFIGRDLP